MGFNTKSYLVAGISMAKLFTEINEEINEFDEFDKYGKKTGKIFKEEKLMAILPNRKEVCIATEKKSFGNGWNYDFYESMQFDGGEFVGDNQDVKISINYGNHDTNDLNQMIMGISVSGTDWANNGDKLVVKVDEDSTNDIIDLVTKELAEMFGYTSGINLYLIQYVSY